MANKGKWKSYLDGLPPWKRNALACLALVLIAAMMPFLLITFQSPTTMLLSLSVFFAILAICRLTHFLLKQCIKNPYVSAFLTIAILIGVMFSSWQGLKWYRSNMAGVCDGKTWSALMMAVVTQYPEYKNSRTQTGVADPERRCMIWESWGVIHVWMETSEPDKCRGIADHLRSVKKEHGIREKIELTIVDWNRTRNCDDVVCRVRPFLFPGKTLSAFPPVFEETLE
jgi:hypothetical protein